MRALQVFVALLVLAFLAAALSSTLAQRECRRVCREQGADDGRLRIIGRGIRDGCVCATDGEARARRPPWSVSPAIPARSPLNI